MAEVKRRYDSTRRRAQAERNRQALADAARRLFATRGYVATTVEAIAGEAGTSAQTFYAAYGSKRGVLFTLLDNMASSADPQALAEALDAAPGPGEQLRLLVDYRVRLYAGALDVLEAVRAAAPTDSDVRAVWAEGERRRRRNQAALLAAWGEAGAVRLPPGRADDVLWALTGPDVYRLLVTERGWTPGAFRDWLFDTLSAQLFGDLPSDR